MAEGKTEFPVPLLFGKKRGNTLDDSKKPLDYDNNHHCMFFVDTMSTDQKHEK